MWDEARHIEIVAKAVEEELGGDLGYGPWTLSWWWMQNEEDPLRRIAVTNCWAERNLMATLRQWRTQAEKRGYSRIAELSDYLQADELTHVRAGTNWIRRLGTEDDRTDLRDWGVVAIDQIEGFFRKPDEPGPPADRDADLLFTFTKPGARDAQEV
jgi:uncharacterized ferritin-like protein (DUF455 family)